MKLDYVISFLFNYDEMLNDSMKQFFSIIRQHCNAIMSNSTSMKIIHRGTILVVSCRVVTVQCSIRMLKLNKKKCDYL